MLRGSSRENTPASRSSALLVSVTRRDQRLTFRLAIVQPPFIYLDGLIGYIWKGCTPFFNDFSFQLRSGLCDLWKSLEPFPRAASVNDHTVVEHRFFGRVTHRIERSTPAAFNDFDIDGRIHAAAQCPPDLLIIRDVNIVIHDDRHPVRISARVGGGRCKSDLFGVAWIHM